jgi:hypothetical protein
MRSRMTGLLRSSDPTGTLAASVPAATSSVASISRKPAR